jgi:subtilisin family serine protease
MMRAVALVLALGLLGAACSSTPARPDAMALSAEVTRSPERFIIAAVDNDAAAFVARAGGTPRGYDAISVYGASPEAQKVMHDVELEYGLREVNAWPIGALHMHCAVLRIPDGMDRAELIAKLQNDRRIRLSEPLQSFATRTDGYNDPYVELQRGFQQMGVAGAHPYSRGDGVRVAIIDTGVDTDHPDLHASVSTVGNFVDADAGQFKRDRHGTEMAGVIAAVANNEQGIVGVAPNARLLIFKACWQLEADSDAARCNSFTLARAIAAAYDAHAQVINMSLAGPEDRLLTELIREGQKRGILFVGAAGPDGGLMRLQGVIEVASLGSAAAMEPVLYAPGSEILTLLPGGHYDFATGVSIATAQVSGVVALMLAKSPNMTADAVYHLLRDTSNARRIDACAAVVNLVQHGTCRPLLFDEPTADASRQRLALH